LGDLGLEGRLVLNLNLHICGVVVQWIRVVSCVRWCILTSMNLRYFLTFAHRLIFSLFTKVLIKWRKLIEAATLPAFIWEVPDSNLDKVNAKLSCHKF
jgi:hypothetical protein